MSKRNTRGAVHLRIPWKSKYVAVSLMQKMNAIDKIDLVFTRLADTANVEIRSCMVKSFTREITALLKSGRIN